MSGPSTAKRALVVGAGQPVHEALGNGRAISLLLAREGAHVCAVDREAERVRPPSMRSSPKVDELTRSLATSPSLPTAMLSSPTQTGSWEALTSSSTSSGAAQATPTRSTSTSPRGST